MSTIANVITAEQLFAMNLQHCELIGGVAKVQDWLHAGCSLVWVVEPKDRTVAVHRLERQVAVLTLRDTITGGDVLPGFSMPVAKVFA
jgi:hypothetical protein